MLMKKQFSLFNKIFCSNLNLLKFPYKLNFAVTYKCNSRCRICNIWQKKPENELTLDEIKKIFENADFFSWVSLTGGEPFLREDLADIARIVSEKCDDLYILNIPTNGFLSEKIYERVKEILSLRIPKCIVTVSLDGPENVHEKIRGIPGGWRKSVETYKRLRELSGKNFDVFFEFTLCPWNTGKFRDTYNAVRKEIPEILPVDFHVNVFHTSEHFYSNINLENEKKFKDNLAIEIGNLCDAKKIVSMNPAVMLPDLYLKLARRYAETGKTPLPCKALLSSCFIDPLGNVFPCTIYNKNLGNLRSFDYNLKKILTCNEIKKTKEIIEKLKCPNCWTPCEAYPMILGNLLGMLW